MTIEVPDDKIEIERAADRRLAADLVKKITATFGEGGYFPFLLYVRINTIKVAMLTMIDSSSYVLKRYHLLYSAIGTSPRTYPTAAIADAANPLPFQAAHNLTLTYTENDCKI
ncbi:MAG: hypothetical protein ACI4SU_06955 [Anaerovoracaceae bacterium]